MSIRIRTYTGLEVDLLANDLWLSIRVIDIAHALSNICRFGGHCRRFYSVAQHAVLASRLVREEEALHALLHDAAEAYVGDMVRPLKAALPQFASIEQQVQRQIWQRFGLRPENPASIQIADEIAFATEHRALMGAWCDGAIPVVMPQALDPENPALARFRFLKRYAELDPDGSSRIELEAKVAITADFPEIFSLRGDERSWREPQP